MKDWGLKVRFIRWNEDKGRWVPVATKIDYEKGIIQTTKAVSGYVSMIFTPEPEFKDVKGNEWYDELLNISVGLGFINGIPTANGVEFQGDKALTKAEFYTIVAKMFGADDSSLYSVLPYTSGLDNSNWYSVYQDLLITNGFINKVEDKAAMSSAITRLEAMVLLTKLAKVADNAETVKATKFSDAKDLGDIEILSSITGYTDGTLKPNNGLTRAEILSLIVKALESMGW